MLLNCSFSIRSHFVSLLGKMVGMEYSPRVEYVNVIVNKDYRGIYILSENVRRDKQRVDVDKDEGYIIEFNPYFWNESFSIKSKLTGFLQWTLKYPKPEDRTEEQEEQIRSDIARLEASVNSDDYPEVIDVRSVARWVLLHDILGTYDPSGSNIYVARKNREPSSLMRMPTGWDMDSSMGNLSAWSKTHTERGFFFSRLFANEKRTDFAETYIDEWRCVLHTGTMERMRDSCRTFPSTAQGLGLARSYPFHAKRWGFPVFDVESMSEDAYNWFAERKETLDVLVKGLEDDVTAIGSPTEDKSHSDSRVRKQLIDGRISITTPDGETYSIDGKRIK